MSHHSLKKKPCDVENGVYCNQQNTVICIAHKQLKMLPIKCSSWVLKCVCHLLCTLWFQFTCILTKDRYMQHKTVSTFISDTVTKTNNCYLLS